MKGTLERRIEAIEAAITVLEKYHRQEKAAGNNEAAQEALKAGLGLALVKKDLEHSLGVKTIWPWGKK